MLVATYKNGVRANARGFSAADECGRMVGGSARGTMTSNYGRSAFPAVQEEIRRRVVRAVLELNVSVADACRLFGVSRTSVWRWLAAVGKHGDKGLASRPRGRPRRCQFAAAQAMQLAKVICTRFPEDCALSPGLWDIDRVRELIGNMFGMCLSRSTMARYARNWGIVMCGPERWTTKYGAPLHPLLRSRYSAISRRGRLGGAAVLWAAIGELHADEHEGIWCRRVSSDVQGGTQLNAGGTGLAQIAVAVSRRGKWWLLACPHALQGSEIVRFLERLLRQEKRRVLLACDGVDLRRFKEVRRYLSQNVERLELVCLWSSTAPSDRHWHAAAPQTGSVDQPESGVSFSAPESAKPAVDP